MNSQHHKFTYHGISAINKLSFYPFVRGSDLPFPKFSHLFIRLLHLTIPTPWWWKFYISILLPTIKGRRFFLFVCFITWTRPVEKNNNNIIQLQQEEQKTQKNTELLSLVREFLFCCCCILKFSVGKKGIKSDHIFRMLVFGHLSIGSVFFWGSPTQNKKKNPFGEKHTK